MSRIGVFGGTFNPIHNGHIQMIEACRNFAGLDKVIVIPSYTPPHKQCDMLADENQRLEMCKIACRNLEFAEISDIEIKRGGTSYTFETLQSLKQIYPDDELCFIMGADMFLSLENWKNPERIFELATIIAVPRNSDDKYDLLKHYTDVLKKMGANAEILNDSVLTVSSTFIRDNILHIERIKDLIDDKVYEYIINNKLYRV